MSSRIAIIDYGMGNLNSVKKKLMRLKADVIIVSSELDIISADKIILPGVGHFQKAMENLRKLNLINALNEMVLVKKKPILGICLGMQLLATRSEEGDAEGLGWIEADVVKFRIHDSLKYKVPHIGWNQISIKKNSKLMNGISSQAEFYFMHSYHLKLKDEGVMLNETEYEYTFASAIEKENIFGVQYHPEKSHDVGELLLKNFIDL